MDEKTDTKGQGTGLTVSFLSELGLLTPGPVFV